MDRKEIKGLSKTQLVELLIEQADESDRLRKQLDESGETEQDGEECQKAVDAQVLRKRRKLNRKSLAIGVLGAFLIIATMVTIFVSCFPVYQVHGSSMSPAINAGDTIVCMRGNNYGVGDIIAIEYQDIILIKRIVAKGGDRIVINESGAVFVNDAAIDEPYATIVENNEQYTAQVPQGKWYILGDNRAISGDSRLREIGTVSDEQIIGRVVLTI